MKVSRFVLVAAFRTTVHSDPHPRSPFCPPVNYKSDDTFYEISETVAGVLLLLREGTRWRQTGLEMGEAKGSGEHKGNLKITGKGEGEGEGQGFDCFFIPDTDIEKPEKRVKPDICIAPVQQTSCLKGLRAFGVSGRFVFQDPNTTTTTRTTITQVRCVPGAINYIPRGEFGELNQPPPPRTSDNLYRDVSVQN
ncbi:hypothetical protein KQX54_016485 [Cotesia glomerata]|uniref:Uncharacterized protein n=1 Tax=Cotesia glomerata TaxID=32391 RepID=A0AAV7HU76_COTGL|nr:hypothetical protein KQX54_016485 [Cotesia glomerata]